MAEPTRPFVNLPCHGTIKIGLLGAEVEQGDYPMERLKEARLLEIERRILALESRLTKGEG